MGIVIDTTRYSVLSEIELYELLYRMFEKITFISENLVSSENKQKAYQLCKDVDEDDTPVVALALQLGAPNLDRRRETQERFKVKRVQLLYR